MEEWSASGRGRTGRGRVGRDISGPAASMGSRAMSSGGGPGGSRMVSPRGGVASLGGPRIDGMASDGYLGNGRGPSRPYVY